MEAELKEKLPQNLSKPGYTKQKEKWTYRSFAFVHNEISSRHRIQHDSRRGYYRMGSCCLGSLSGKLMGHELVNYIEMLMILTVVVSFALYFTIGLVRIWFISFNNALGFANKITNKWRGKTTEMLKLLQFSCEPL